MPIDRRSAVDTMDARSSLKPGDTFAGKYRVDRVLGQGGMGVVIGATHQHTHARVALKFLLPEAAAQPMVRARFMNEARAAVQIKSEHVAHVTDVDITADGTPYMVMEYLEGSDLADVLTRSGPLPTQAVADHVLQACEALSEAHALGIVHRDLKPGNLFLTHRKDGSDLIKVLDFGISKVESANDARLTSTRGVMGSPLYMSPEQLTRPKDVDPRSDIWSLGVVMFELLTGTWPFEAATMEGLAVQIVTEPPRSLRALRPDLPEWVERIVQRCLEKKPEQRFSSVAELANALVPMGSLRASHSAERISRVLSSAPHLSSPVLPAAQAITVDPVTVPTPAFASAPTALPTALGTSAAPQQTSASWAATNAPRAEGSPSETPVHRSPLPFFAAGLVLAAMGAIFVALRPNAPATAEPSAKAPSAAASVSASLPATLATPSASASGGPTSTLVTSAEAKSAMATSAAAKSAAPPTLPAATSAAVPRTAAPPKSPAKPNSPYGGM